MKSLIWKVTAAVSAALLIATASPANAAPAGDREINGTEEAAGGVTSEIYDGLIKAGGQLPEAFNSLEWDEVSKKLLVHYNGDASALQDSLEAALPSSSFEMVKDTFSVKLLEEEAWRLASSGTMVNGQAITSAGPLPDGSGIQVSVEGNPPGRNSKTATEKLSAFPISLSFEERATTADRTYDPVAPHWGGATMSTPASDPAFIVTCTTGFGVGYMNGSNLVTSMITADHCGATGSQWRTGKYSDSPILGTLQNTSAVGTDIKRMSGASFGPVIYGGAHNANSGIGIKGAITPVLNDSWCYSGAPSGQVCNNKVTSLNMTVCYAINQCYRNMVYSEQLDNIPAVGQGDSGGPVIAARNGNAYAVGIISGIRFGNTTCNANSDGRKCSKSVITAPVEGFFQDNPSYGILTYQQ